MNMSIERSGNENCMNHWGVGGQKMRLQNTWSFQSLLQDAMLPTCPYKPECNSVKGPYRFFGCSICHYLPLYSVLVYLLHGLLHATKVQAPRKAETLPILCMETWKPFYPQYASPSTHVGVQVKSLCCCQSSQL